MAFGSLLSGRTKKKVGSQLDSDRYSFLDIQNAEPDLGNPTSPHSLVTSTTDGTRSFAGLGTGLSYDSATQTVFTDESTLAIDTTNLTYSTSSNLAAVLEDLDSSLNSLNDGVGQSLVAVSTDGTIDGNGTEGDPLTIGQRVDSGADVIFGDVTATEVLFDTVTPHTGVLPAGHLCWNDSDGTLNLGLKGDRAVLQVGQEQVYYVLNNTGATIPDGTVVGSVGVQGGRILVAPYIADGTFLPEQILGVTTEDIANSSEGYVTTFGYVRHVNTTAYTVGDRIFASATTAGSFTDTIPTAPDLKIIIGIVTEVGTSGTIFCNPNFTPIASDITYDNTSSLLVSSTVQGALDELQETKADVGLLSSNVTLYSTDDSADVAGYFTLVSSTADSDFDVTAVDIPTGVIDSDNILLASLISDTNQFSGQIGGINVTTIGNIDKTADNVNHGASFYFEVYRRDSADNELLIGTSNTTDPIYETTGYEQFFTSALIQTSDDAEFTANDRVVLKFYGNNQGGGVPEYNFQFGGLTPVRTLFPVPSAVIPTADGTGIFLDTTNFNNKLSAADDTTQKALDTLDDHVHSTSEITEGSRLYYTDGRANAAIDARVTKTFVDALNVDADTLDSLNSTQFLRSDQDDSMSGSLTIDGQTTHKSAVNYQSDSNSISVEMVSDTLSFEGTSGQLFSITDTLTGTIFSVNDMSGIPSIEVDDDGTIRLAEIDGNILIGTDSDRDGNKLQLDGGFTISGYGEVIDSAGQWVGDPTGLQGPQGVQGIQGIQGVQGQQGLQGIQGNVGIQGVQGQQGLQGIQGVQGQQGIQGVQGTFGTQGLQGVQGQQGIQGIQGIQGVQGTDGNFGGATFDYTFSSTITDSDPGVGKLRFNNTTITSATRLYIDDQDDNGTDIQSFLRTIDDSTSTIKGHFRISNRLDASDFAVFIIDGVTVEATGYFRVSCSYISGSAAQFSDNEDVIITFARTGDKGDIGVQGVQGQQGLQGIQGIQGVQGQQGVQGRQGLQGTTGSQGTTGQQGTQGIQGEQGIQGFIGAQGTQGTQGTTGAQGTTGEQGLQGIQGIQGRQGITGSQGLQGTQGIQGRQGIQGAEGNFGGATFDYTFDASVLDTDPGVGNLRLNNSVVASSTKLILDDADDNGTDIQAFIRTIDDSTSPVKGHFRISNRLDASDFAIFTISALTEKTGYFVVDCAYVSGSATSFSDNEDIIITFARTGDIGAQGTQGIQGVQGQQGLQGPQGTQGLQGPQGTQGLQGEQGIQGIQGWDGEQGLQGIQGVQGRQGPQGTQGLQGTTGTQGLQGIQGIQGIQGPEGPVAGGSGELVYNNAGNPDGTDNIVYDNVDDNIRIHNTYHLDGESITLSTTGESAIMNYSATKYGGAKVLIQATRGTDRHVSEFIIAHDGTNAYATEYGKVITSEDLAIFDVDISGGNVRVLATGTSATATTYRITKQLFVA